MAETTKIAWCDATWNFVRGCQKVSEGCASCYAETMSLRNPATLGIWGPPGIGQRVLGALDYLNAPHRWHARRLRGGTTGTPFRVFCASLADVFEDWPEPLVDSNGTPLCYRADDPGEKPVPAAGGIEIGTGHPPYTMTVARRRVFRTMAETRSLTWLVLTKRPENIRRMVPPKWLEPMGWPAHVWPGATAETQARADERGPVLAAVPAPVTWFSVEPQIGPVGLVDRPWWPGAYRARQAMGFRGPPISWLIVGGESGSNARPFAFAWARALRDECRLAGVKFFFKQAGAWPYDGPALAALPPLQITRGGKRLPPFVEVHDPKGGDDGDIPGDLWVREFPGVARG